MRTYPSIGVAVTPVLLPRDGIDLSHWAVIACDQFTSQPEYWQAVAQQVDAHPSTYRLVLPEVFLGKPQEEEHVASIHAAMQAYLEQGLFEAHEGLVLVERSVAGHTRHGLMLALDLEQYDYNPGSQTLIRATEGTILERLPPRMKIREGALLEVPHILVLIDDPTCSVIEPLADHKTELQPVYDGDLMLGSGHLRGYFVPDLTMEHTAIAALETLAAPQTFQARYGVGPDQNSLLFAMGDGNHSFATAKAIWEKVKNQAGPDHPARYALVEIENVHDDGLEFEPIHRVLFHVREHFQAAMRRYWGDRFRFQPCADLNEMLERVDQSEPEVHAFGIISSTGYALGQVSEPAFNLPVGTLQAFLDEWQHDAGFAQIDYVHGQDVVATLGSRPGNLGFYLPAMHKSDLFKTVILDGALPRKTFSMGSAIEKRFYVECRKIVP